MPKSPVSVAGHAGIPVRLGASTDVLTSVNSVNSMGGFHAVGGSVIPSRMGLFFLALAGGIGLSIIHMTMRLIFRRFGNRPPH